MITRRTFLKISALLALTCANQAVPNAVGNSFGLSSTSQGAVTPTLATGFHELDTLLGGTVSPGFKRGSLNCIVGQLGSGKHSLTIQLAHHFAMNGNNVMYFPLAECSQSAGLRWKMQHGNILQSEIREMTAEVRKQIGAQTLGEIPPNLIIDDRTPVGAADVERFIFQHVGQGLDLDKAVCFLEHSWALDAHNEAGGAHSADMSWLYALAHESGMCIIVLCNGLRNIGKERTRKQFEASHARYFRNFVSQIHEQDVDTELMLFRVPERDNPQDYFWPHSDKAKLVLSKNRYGSTGETVLWFNEKYNTFLYI